LDRRIVGSGTDTERRDAKEFYIVSKKRSDRRNKRPNSCAACVCSKRGQTTSFWISFDLHHELDCTQFHSLAWGTRPE